MKKEITFNANVYCGRRVKYTKRVKSYRRVVKICQKFCNKIGECITITKTEYVYKNGKEKGVVISFIQYPRFPKTIEEMKNRALTLGSILLKELEQNRISIEFTDETILLE